MGRGYIYGVLAAVPKPQISEKNTGIVVKK